VKKNFFFLFLFFDTEFDPDNPFAALLAGSTMEEDKNKLANATKHLRTLSTAELKVLIEFYLLVIYFYYLG
jgi:hypothetical protein